MLFSFFFTQNPSQIPLRIVETGTTKTCFYRGVDVASLYEKEISIPARCVGYLPFYNRQL